MPTLDVKTLLNQMVEAAKTSLKDKWPAIRDLATSSFKNLAQTVVDIEEMQLRGTITHEQAQLLLNMQKNNLKIALLTEEGLGLLAVEAAINAVLDGIKNTVNTAIGFAIL